MTLSHLIAAIYVFLLGGFVAFELTAWLIVEPLLRKMDRMKLAIMELMLRNYWLGVTLERQQELLEKREDDDGEGWKRG